MNYTPTHKIDWSLRKDKRESDHFLVDTVAKGLAGRTSCRALTFPAAGFLMEQMLSEATPDIRWKVDGIDCNKNVVKAGNLTIISGILANKKIDASLKHGRFLDMLEEFNTAPPVASSWQYDLVYPDWMGTWTLEKREELDIVFRKNMIKPGGFLAGTLSLCRGWGPAMDELEYFAEGDPVEVIDNRPNNRARETSYHMRTSALPRYIMAQAARHGMALQNPKVMVYDSTVVGKTNKIPQMKMVFRRSYV